MKLFSFLILLGLFVACDPYGFGFKKNPAYILNVAFQAVLSSDHEAFLAVSGKEALCLYGNPEGISYLRTNLKIDEEKIEIKPKLISNLTKRYENPIPVGFWSYYQEIYQIDILDKVSKEALLGVVVECNYGFAGQKKPEYAKVTKTKKYKMKECVLIKVMPSKFAALPIKAKCQPLKVTL
ncbi:MAG: hypothetical protein H0V66_08690 [Bdellovibrionales bacterium]|nr:hypothetical protein [Bdellovibrionales bacterium]